jgi:hypothetical protein
MAQFGVDVVEDLQLLDIKLKQLRNEYEQYFMGTRNREPFLLRGEVQKMITYYANVPIQNTANRFKFNNLRARFFSFRRHWDRILREIEEGRYERHMFRAKLRDRERAAASNASPPRGGPKPARPEDVFESYVSAREACGQGSQGITREKLDALLEKQSAQLRARYGCRDVKFRVVVEDGKAKLKASPVRG